MHVLKMCSVRPGAINQGGKFTAPVNTGEDRKVSQNIQYTL